MLKISLLSLFLGLLLSTVVSNVSAKIVQRIVVGQHAPPGRFLHQVSLQMLNGDCTHHLCGGSILDDIHIITAAHCVTDLDTHVFDEKQITVVAGTTDLRDKNSGIYRDVEYIFMPTLHTKNLPGQYYDDIAILKLKRPLPLGSDERIKAINLPANNYQYQPPYTQVAVVSGFGSYRESKNPYNGKVVTGPNSPRLKFAKGWINVADIPPCTEKQICVRNYKSHGACRGDSGGPLIDESTNTLIGIVSYSNHALCGNTTKYTRVSSYLEFIEKVRAGGWFYHDDGISIIRNDFNNERKIQSNRHCDQLSDRSIRK